MAVKLNYTASPPKAKKQPWLTKYGWQQYVQSWTVEEAWWVAYTMEVSNVAVMLLFEDFKKQKKFNSFGMWCTAELHKKVLQGVYEVPVQLLDVYADGMNTEITLRVGPLELKVNEHVANLLLKDVS